MEVEVTTKAIIVFDEAGAYGEFEEIEVETNGVWVPRFGLLVNANIGIGGHYPLLHCAGFDSSTHAEAVRTAVAYSDAVIHHLTKHEAMVKAINTYMDAKKAFYAHGGTKGKFETAFLDSQAPIDHAWATFTFIPEAYE